MNIFQNISFYVLQKEKVIQVWHNMKMSKFLGNFLISSFI